MMDTGSAATTVERYLQQLLRASGLELEYTIDVQVDASTDAEAAQLTVRFTGPDVSLLTERDAELLHAVEIVASSILRLDRSEHHLLVFDAGGLRAQRARSLEQAADEAIDRVRTSGQPFSFPPMNSRDRRLLHLAAATAGLPTASTGEGPRRSVVIYPAGQTPPPAVPRRPWGDEDRRQGSARRPVPSRTPGYSRPPQAPKKLEERDFNAAPAKSLQSPDEAPDAAAQAERIRAIRERFRKR